MLGMNSRMRPRRMKFEITDLDELQTFVGKSDKKSGSGLPRITGVRASWLGLWETGCGNVQALVVDCQVLAELWYGARWLYGLSSVRRRFHLLSKTYMTRIEGENTELRHYLARLHRKTLLLQVD